MTVKILNGDCRQVLKTLPAGSVHCCVTSPPYWGLRDYGVEPSVWGGDGECSHDWEDQIWYTEQSAAKTNGSVEAFSKPGAANAQRLKDARWRTDGVCKCGAWRGAFGLEPTYQLYVEHAVEIFREVRRVLRDDGTLWLNLGDGYSSHDPGGYRDGEFLNPGGRKPAKGQARNRAGNHTDLRRKNLIGVPWRVAFALQADRWILRQDIIWSKPNPMPESVTDRCTKAHEYLFLLSKSERYYFDAKAIAEESIYKEGEGGHQRFGAPGGKAEIEYGNQVSGNIWNSDGTRNKRSVWSVNTAPFPEAHFATFPPALIEPCVRAGSPIGGTVLDPFGGAGTTGLVAHRLERNAILIELNADYVAMAARRIAHDTPLLDLIRNAGDRTDPVSPDRE
jgi:DNA modification methylase